MPRTVGRDLVSDVLLELAETLMEPMGAALADEEVLALIGAGGLELGNRASLVSAGRDAWGLLRSATVEQGRAAEMMGRVAEPGRRWLLVSVLVEVGAAEATADGDGVSQDGQDGQDDGGGEGGTAGSDADGVAYDRWAVSAEVVALSDVTACMLARMLLSGQSLRERVAGMLLRQHGAPPQTAPVCGTASHAGSGVGAQAEDGTLPAGLAVPQGQAVPQADDDAYGVPLEQAMSGGQVGGTIRRDLEAARAAILRALDRGPAPAGCPFAPHWLIPGPPGTDTTARNDAIGQPCIIAGNCSHPYVLPHPCQYMRRPEGQVGGDE